MTVYSKRAIAIPNPDAEDPNGKDGEIRFGYEKFNYGIPDTVRNHPYFKSNVDEGNLIVIEDTKDVEKVVEGTAPKRANAQKEANPADIGIADGGEPKK